MGEFEKLKQDTIKLSSRDKGMRWIENYWYHYKWRTIIGAFFLFVFLLLLTQCLGGANRKDAVVTYCGPRGFLLAETEGVRDVLNELLPTDFDGDGERYVELVRYQVYSEQELKEDRLQNDNKGTINISYNAQQIKAFNDFMMTGESSIYLLSPYMYDYVSETRKNLRPLQEVFDALPVQAYDEYAVRLGDTAIYQAEAALQLLPADTLVCLARPYAIGSSADPEIYQNSVDMFRAIVSGNAKMK